MSQTGNGAFTESGGPQDSGMTYPFSNAGQATTSSAFFADPPYNSSQTGSAAQHVEVHQSTAQLQGSMAGPASGLASGQGSQPFRNFEPYTATGQNMSGNTLLPQTFNFQTTPSDASSSVPVAQMGSFGVPPIASTSQSQGEASMKSPPTRSRPIPRVAAAYRMATLADPSSHEAPFRPLTYHPDIFRNSEMSRQASPEPSAQSNGRRTPKSGKGDAVELGIFSEEHARALFAL